MIEVGENLTLLIESAIMCAFLAFYFGRMKNE